MDKYRLYKGAWVVESHPHKSTKIVKKQAIKILAGGGYFLKNVYDFDNSSNHSYWYLIKDSFGGIEELPSKVRNQVRKSLKTYSYIRVDKEQMAVLGYELFNKSRERFKDKTLFTTKEDWLKSLDTDNQEYWMGFEKETQSPATFGINTVYDDYCDYNTMGISPDFPNNTYPMYGLIYEMNRYYLEEKKLKYVLDGARSITEHSNIQPFLEEKFNFRKAYCGLQIFYQPWLGLVVRLLYPFRCMIKTKKIKSLLNQEAMVRGDF